MDRRDDLASMITEKLQELSGGIDEKINNAGLQAKVVSDLSAAVRSHLVKISQIANSDSEPQAILQAIGSAINNLNAALQNEESRVKANYSTLMARKSVLAEVDEVVKEEIDSHKHWIQKRSEIQERHLAGENLLKPKAGQHPESIRDVRNALEDLPQQPEPEPPAPEPAQAEKQLVQIHEPEPVQEQPEPAHSAPPEEVSNSTQDEPEPPQHVSRFFSGE